MYSPGSDDIFTSDDVRTTGRPASSDEEDDATDHRRSARDSLWRTDTHSRISRPVKRREAFRKKERHPDARLAVSLCVYLFIALGIASSH